MGTNTDPYQRAEGRYRLMPGIIDALARSGTPFSVLTKGTRPRPRPAAARAAAARTSRSALGVSIALLDRDAAAPRSSPARRRPRPRLELVRRDHRRRPAVRRDGRAGAAAAHRLDRGARRPARPDRRRGRHRGDACSRCTCGRAPASGSWPGWRASTRSWSSRTRGSTGAGPTWTRAYRRALAERVAPLLRRHRLTSEVAPLPATPASGPGAAGAVPGSIGLHRALAAEVRPRPPAHRRRRRAVPEVSGPPGS